MNYIIIYIIQSLKWALKSNMKDERNTIVDFISSHEGIQKVETVLDRHWVYIYLEDDILEDERFDLRVPLRDMGFPVDRWEVLLEKPDSHD